MPRVWGTACDHVRFQGLCHFHYQVDLSGQAYHLGSWYHLDQGCGQAPCLRPWPYNNKICVDVCGSEKIEGCDNVRHLGSTGGHVSIQGPYCSRRNGGPNGLHHGDIWAQAAV